MRRKKHKHTRRAVQFYKLSFGFHEPYKVLVDGNFIHATQSSNLTDLYDHIARLLGGRVKLYVTRCMTRELEDLGVEVKEASHYALPGVSGTMQALAAARGFNLHKCEHGRGECSAAACIQEQIGDSNPSRWWVATQDRAVRAALALVPGCPLIFATVNGIHLEEPQGLSLTTAHQESEAHQALPAHERCSQALQDLDSLRRRPATKSIFRRNKAKGPNPLSVRKKATKLAPPAHATKAPLEASDGQPRRKEGQGPASAAGGQAGATVAGGPGERPPSTAPSHDRETDPSTVKKAHKRKRKRKASADPDPERL
ncbi:hypothetical protein QJQ45_023316 [Haematococcus lacustris]|nr:hypothetical protein QJQ45_023316 [Haematococcus lacustris]